MERIAIITDSNSGITQDEAKELGIILVAMPFFINGDLYFEELTLTHEEFYELQNGGADITTSQPSPGDILDFWDDALTKYDTVLHIPMSSGLSSSYETAAMLAEDYDNRVQVVNNQRISITQKQSVMDAIELAKQGKTAVEIKNILEETKFDSSIYITLETLKYLKKGGRITPAAAALGTILNLKPVLQIQGEKLDAFAKARGKKQAKRIMLEAIRNDLNTRFKDADEKGDMYVQAAYAGNPEEAAEWKKEIQEAFPQYTIEMDPLSLSIATHIGQGALAIGCMKKIV